MDAANVRRFKRRLRRYRIAVQTGQMAFAKACDCVRSWIAHAEHADTAMLRRKILMDESIGATFLRSVANWRSVKTPPTGLVNKGDPWRVLEQ